jgi:electron transport complex protein RnfB
MRQTCLTFGPAAKGMVDGGAAHFIERHDTLEMLDAADREGLVLQPQNTQEPWFVCCCCGCCCGVLRSAKALPNPAAAFKATYHAASDPEVCAGCSICESRCQMEAIQMIDGSAAVDLTRCIGCGLCVTTCSTGAMHLAVNETSTEPPKSTPALYMKMYRERFGTYELAKAIASAVIGRRI